MEHNETFNADAAIVWRLGAELFTDSTQALLELIKNSYDADATQVIVDIDRVKQGRAGAGRIRIADDGHGMDESSIREGWLVLSASPKRAQKARGETTARHGRLPLGDKGLGRLGAQLLGDNLRLNTRPRPAGGAADAIPEVEHDVVIDFSRFVQGRLLTSIRPSWTTTDELSSDWSGPKPWGTVLEIDGLGGNDTWLDEQQLARRLSVLINPYRRIDKFKLSVSLDGEALDIAAISRQVREAALGRWHVDYSGSELTLRGLLRADWFRPRDQGRLRGLQKALARNSEREEFCRRIDAVPTLREYRVRPAAPPWLVEVTRTFRIPEDLEAIPGVDPGRFEMELDIVSLQLAVARGASLAIFDRQAEYRGWIKERAGVNVYRDGFVVASGFDLLRLGAAFTGGGSYYGMRPQNVMGYIAISGRDNPRLQETTNRQAFRHSPAFSRFEALLDVSRDAINRVLDEAGRAGGDYAAELQTREQGLFGLTADELVETTVDLARRAKSASAVMSQVERVLTSVTRTATQLDPLIARDANAALDGLKEAGRVIASAEQLAPVAANLRDRIDQLQDAHDELIATAALGIAAEGLAHDLTAIVQRLSDRAKKARTEVSGLPPQVQLLLDDVRWAAGALRSQLRHLDPMLRNSRLRREHVDLGTVVAGAIGYHRDRLAPTPITVRMHRESPATLRLSPGRLGQVLDNLVLNSEYWLTAHPPKGAPAIDVSVAGSTITFADNGPGVDPALGDDVFEPFVTRRFEGRGLGLWLARQLLDADGASIALAQDPDTGRLTKFIIEYPVT
jgi:signal transduction histidine kinase